VLLSSLPTQSSRVPKNIRKSVMGDAPMLVMELVAWMNCPVGPKIKLCFRMMEPLLPIGKVASVTMVP
jgi:hypothetical protein